MIDDLDDIYPENDFPEDMMRNVAIMEMLDDEEQGRTSSFDPNKFIHWLYSIYDRNIEKTPKATAFFLGSIRTICPLRMILNAYVFLVVANVSLSTFSFSNFFGTLAIIIVWAIIGAISMMRMESIKDKDKNLK